MKKGGAFYDRRMQTAEPMFGIIKKRMCYREFTLRGLVNVKGEWNMAMLRYDAMLKHTLSLMVQNSCSEHVSIIFLKLCIFDLNLISTVC
ncbi:MAG: transposase [Deltaproteobacteria bacterium]|nr:transposase [Deltaproteobacteria bacterium]